MIIPRESVSIQARQDATKRCACPRGFRIRGSRTTEAVKFAEPPVNEDLLDKIRFLGYRRVSHFECDRSY